MFCSYFLQEKFCPTPALIYVNVKSYVTLLGIFLLTSATEMSTSPVLQLFDVSISVLFCTQNEIKRKKEFLNKKSTNVKFSEMI